LKPVTVVRIHIPQRDGLYRLRRLPSNTRSSRLIPRGVIGSTTDSESVSLGSNPGGGAKLAGQFYYG
jgi:hypothetical protein